MAFKDYRICLKCSKEFESEHPGNRICPKCTIANQRVAKLGIAVIEKFPTVPGIQLKDEL